MTSWRAVAVWLAVLGACGLATFAQEPPPNELAPLQAKETFTDEERGALRKWISQRIDAVLANDPAASAIAVEELRKANTGTEGFKELYAEAAINLIAPAAKRAELIPASRLIALLNLFNRATAQPTLVEMLRDERAGVRTAAAVALRNLRVKLALAGGNYVTDTLNALREAGKVETSLYALDVIYRAMNFPEVVPSPPDPAANARAVLDVVEARAQQYASGKVKGEGAEVTGLAVIDGLRQQLSDAERGRLVIATATILRYAVVRYGAELYKVDRNSGELLEKTRDDCELLIEQAEKLLAQIVPNEGKLPSITKVMRESKVDAKPFDMKREMNVWADILQRVTNQNFQIADTPAGEGPG